MLDPLAVYIHWPYCARICPYCDFNVYKSKSGDGLLEAIGADLYEWFEWSGHRMPTSIHFGGGTPSLLTPLQVKYLLDVINDECWGITRNCEIAIEANPLDADESKWRGYVKSGINRLSLGVQSFHVPALKLLGRDHDAQQAREACKLARDVFPSVSLDLIFGWAGQTEDILRRDLEIAMSYNPDHISTYQLTIEPGTAFAKAEMRGDSKTLDEDQSAGLYDIIREHLLAKGFDHYEVSNFAKPGHQSQHNLAYWRGQDYVGVGPGAHGRLTIGEDRYATVAAMRPADYERTVLTTGLGLMEKECLSPHSRAEEYALMGLRIDEGISAKRFAAINGEPFVETRLQSLIQEGLLDRTGDRIKATIKGRLLLNWVTDKLLLG